MGAELSGVKDRLLKNIFTIAVGNFGSRFLGFLLIPLFSFYLSPAEMGFLDVMLVTVELAVPFATLELRSSAYRWLVVADEYADRKAVISTTLVGFLFPLATTICLYTIGTFFFPIVEYPILVCSFFVISCLNAFCSAFVRGMKQNRLYALSDLIRSVVVVFFAWVLLTGFCFGMEGMLIAYLLAGTASIALVTYGLRLWRYVSVRGFSKKLLFEFLAYTLPTIPYAVSWWLMNSANRYVILHFLGEENNGIYAISSRIAMILYIVYSVFHTAWQESAFTEFNSGHRDELYSDTFDKYFTISTTAVIALMPFAKILILYVLSSDYADSWRYLPILLVGVVFSTFSSFFSTGYTGAKKTSGIMYTVLFGAAANITCCWLLVPKIGLQGASIGVAIGFLVTLFLQVWQTRKFFKIRINVQKVVRNMVVVAVAMCLVFVVEDLFGLIFFSAVAMLFFLYANRSIFNMVMRKIKEFKNSGIQRIAGESEV